MQEALPLRHEPITGDGASAEELARSRQFAPLPLQRVLLVLYVYLATEWFEAARIFLVHILGSQSVDKPPWSDLLRETSLLRP